MDKKTKERVERILQKDERYKRIRKSFRTLPQYSLCFDDLREELKILHSQRKLHKLEVVNPNFVKHLSDAATTDHSFRSRITEILVLCSSVRTSLSKTLDGFEKYVLNEYAADLRSISTKDERRHFVQGVMQDFYSYLYDVEQLVEICKYYIDNIDKGGYMVKELVQAFTVIRKFEG